MKHLLLLNNSVTTLMIDSVKADDGEGECNLEMDQDKRESSKRVNIIISTIEKRFSVKSSSIYSFSFCAKLHCWIFNDLSPIFRFNSIHVIDNDLFHNNQVPDANNTSEKEKICHFLKMMHSVRKKSPNHS